MLTGAQQTARADTLGSSDAPVVVGVSPYQSARELYHKMRGDLPRYTDEDTHAQRIGSRLEPVIAQLCAEELGLKIRRSAPRRSRRVAWMSANLDFEIVHHPRGPGVLEIKNRSGCEPWDHIPDDIEIQVRHQLAVTERAWGLVAVLFQFGAIHTYPVERDAEMETDLVAIEGRFMRAVAEGTPPDLQWDAQGVELLRRLHPRDTGRQITLDAHYADVAARLEAARMNAKDAEADKSTAAAELMAAMGDASEAEIPGFGSLTWKCTKAGHGFDEGAFKLSNPDLWAQYQRVRPGYRVLRLKPQKEEPHESPRQTGAGDTGSGL